MPEGVRIYLLLYLCLWLQLFQKAKDKARAEAFAVAEAKPRGSTPEPPQKPVLIKVVYIFNI